MDSLVVPDIDLLRRWRASGREDEGLLRALVTTVNGKGVLPETHPLSVGASVRLAPAQELLGDAAGQTLDAHLGAERDHFVRNLQHANAGEGIAAFLEKRAPRYQ